MGVGAGLYMCDVVVKSSRSLSHLLMSSCSYKWSLYSRWHMLSGANSANVRFRPVVRLFAAPPNPTHATRTENPFLANVNSRSRSLYAIARPSVVCRLSVSVTIVRPTQTVQIFGNISTVLGTLAIHRHPLKILRRSTQGNPSTGGVKHKRGSKI